MVSCNNWSLLIAVSFCLQLHVTRCDRCLLDESEVKSAIWSRLTYELTRRGLNVTVEEIYYNCVSFYSDMKTVRKMKITVFTNVGKHSDLNNTDYFSFRLSCSGSSYKTGWLIIDQYYHNQYGERANQTMCGSCGSSWEWQSVCQRK